MVINRRNMRFLMQANKIAKTSRSNFRVGAIVAKGSRFLGVGVNSSKTHPSSNSWCKSTHAEHQALINGGFNDLNGATAYVFRETKDGRPAMAKPCNSCAALLKQAGIKKVFFSQKEFPFWGIVEYN